MTLENIFENKKLAENFNQTLNFYSETPIALESFLTFKQLLESKYIKIPKDGKYFLLGDYNYSTGDIDLEKIVEIRYFPKITEIQINENNYEKLGIKKEDFSKVAYKKLIQYEISNSDIIADHYSLESIEDIGISSNKLIEFDNSIISPNESGFIILRSPLFYVNSDKTKIELVKFYGSKKADKDDYYSPDPIYNDRVLNKLEEGKTYIQVENNN